MMDTLRRRIGQMARMPGRMWNHASLWRSRRREVANWAELWGASNPVRLVVEEHFHPKRSSRELTIRFRNGLSLTVDNSMRGALTALVDTYPSYMRNLGISLEPGDIVIDVGAHVGAFSIPALFYNPGIKILAFEPDPVNFRLLKENAVRNGLQENGLFTFNLAVADTEGQLMFARGRTSTTGSIARSGFFKAAPASEIVLVSATNIENIFHQHSIDRCRLLKVDCEGSEYEIFERLPEAILSRIENIIVEVHPARAGTPAELKSGLEMKGFRVLERAHGNGCSDLYCRRPV
jgi:FkbM family methyltransferase